MYALCSIFAYVEEFMPLLQVRDFLEEVYESLTKAAKEGIEFVKSTKV